MIALFKTCYTWFWNKPIFSIQDNNLDQDPQYACTYLDPYMLPTSSELVIVVYELLGENKLPFWWDDNICFVLDKCAEWNFYSFRQHSVEMSTTRTHCWPSQLVFLLTPLFCMLGIEATNTNFYSPWTWSRI